MPSRKFSHKGYSSPKMHMQWRTETINHISYNYAILYEMFVSYMRCNPSCSQPESQPTHSHLQLPSVRNQSSVVNPMTKPLDNPPIFIYQILIFFFLFLLWSTDFRVHTVECRTPFQHFRELTSSGFMSNRE